MKVKRLFAAVLLTAVLSAQMSWAAGTEPPVDLNPAEEQTLLHVGREYLSLIHISEPTRH